VVIVTEFEIANQKHEATVILEKIQHPIDYDAELSISTLDLDKVSKKVILVSQVIKTTGDSSKAVMQIGSSVRTFQNIPPTESLTLGLGIGSIFIATVDFLLIPFVYLTCHLLGTKAPVTPENNAKWFFSGIALALSITSIAVPAVAIAIAFTATSISLALSLFLLGKTISEYYQLSKAQRAIKKAISHAEAEMEVLQKKVPGLKTALGNCATTSELISLCEQIALLNEDFEAQKKYLLELKLKELDLNKKFKDANFSQIINKGVGFSLSAVALIGLIVSLYFPLAGLGILTAISVLSLAFLVVRVAIPLIKVLVGWVRSKFGAGDSATGDLTETYEHTQEPSTDSMLEYFFGSKENARDMLKIVPPKDIDHSLRSTGPLFQAPKDTLAPQQASEQQSRYEFSG